MADPSERNSKRRTRQVGIARTPHAILLFGRARPDSGGRRRVGWVVDSASRSPNGLGKHLLDFLSLYGRNFDYARFGLDLSDPSLQNRSVLLRKANWKHDYGGPPVSGPQPRGSDVLVFTKLAGTSMSNVDHTGRVSSASSPCMRHAPFRWWACSGLPLLGNERVAASFGVCDVMAYLHDDIHETCHCTHQQRHFCRALRCRNEHVVVCFSGRPRSL